jgi:hypothetical protein
LIRFHSYFSSIDIKLGAMALRHLGKYMAGMATGVAATGAAHCAEQDKYFDPEALERGAKVRF